MTVMTEVKRENKSADRASSFPKRRRILIQFFCICLPLWLSFKIYDGPYNDQVRIYLAGGVFLIVWALIIQIIRPRLRETPVLIALFLVFCAIELIAWQAPGLFENVSLSLAGRPLIGEVFTLHKIPYYGVGAFIGYFILKACRFK